MCRAISDATPHSDCGVLGPLPLESETCVRRGTHCGAFQRCWRRCARAARFVFCFTPQCFDGASFFSGEDPTVLLLLLLVSVIDVDGRRVARVFSEATQTRCEESCAEIAESCEDEERVSGRTDLHLLDFNEDTLHFLRCLAVS